MLQATTFLENQRNTKRKKTTPHGDTPDGGSGNAASHTANAEEKQRQTPPTTPPRQAIHNDLVSRDTTTYGVLVGTDTIALMMILLLLFLQKQSLAFAVYLFGIGTLLTGPGLKKKAHVIMLSP